MKRFALIAASLAAATVSLASAQQAEERRKVSPIAIQGRWLGTPGALPPECGIDGFIIGFGTNNGQTFNMSVQKRETGIAPLKAFETVYRVIEPPAGAPLRIELFLEAEKDGQKLVMGIDHTGGSTLEIVPAGTGGNFPATSLYLRRCSS